MFKTSMNHQSHRRFALSFILLFLAAVISVQSGCGGGEAGKAELDPISLLKHFKKETPRHHPVDLVELDLGKYDVTIPVPGSSDVYRVAFHAFAIVPTESKSVLTEKLKKFMTRSRDLILMAAQNMNAEKDSDPYQAWLKSEILDSISGLLKTRDVRDIVFSKYNFERS